MEYFDNGQYIEHCETRNWYIDGDGSAVGVGVTNLINCTCYMDDITGTTSRNQFALLRCPRLIAMKYELNIQ